MKYKQKLTTGITLVNKKYKKNQFYHFFQEPNNVIVIPVIKTKFIVISQKREPINKKNFEFPMGWIDKGEAPHLAGERELLEETGYKSKSMIKKLVTFYADPGRGSRFVYSFYAKNLIKIQKPEKDISVSIKSKKQIISLIKKKQFNNASHIAAFFSYLYLV
jgi:ADP-ribose pyrophosphatase